MYRIVLLLLFFLTTNLGAQEENWRNPKGKQPISKSINPNSGSTKRTPTDKWAVRLSPDADVEAICTELQAKHLGPIGTLKNYHQIQFNLEEADAGIIDARLKNQSGVLWFERQFSKQMAKKNTNDPLVGNQWHLNNTGQSGGLAGEDIRAFDAWTAGYTGTGVQICIIDDGLESTHVDIAPNFVLADSWNINAGDPPGSAPTPGASDSHGTACGGVAGAKGNNGIGVAGVAYDATLSGIRLIAAGNTDADEANALTFNYNNNHIFSNSWGPPDDAARLEAPGPLAAAALEDGINNGRSGKGAIYTWAAGNGLCNNDNVNYDAYASSIYTIAVGAYGHDGVQSYYSEPGASMHITAPSNSGTCTGSTNGITTVDLTGAAGYDASDYTNTFGGTSSATPAVSGAIALMLQANPNLGWRDVQYILAQTARKINPADAGWATNGAGMDVNHKYGFGAVDANAAAALAATWTNVTAQLTNTSAVSVVNAAIPDSPSTGTYASAVSNVITVTDNFQVEHARIIFNATHPYRGDLRIRLTSPDGTVSFLTELHNDGNDNIVDWPFMTVHNWGELSAGDWTLTVDDGGQGDAGTFVSWQLELYGRAANACTPNNGDLIAN